MPIKLQRSLFVVVVACMAILAHAQPQTSPANLTTSPLPVLATNTPCRMKPEVETCGLPLFLANWQVSKISLDGRGADFYFASPGAFTYYV